MDRIAQFEKVSLERFRIDAADIKGNKDEMWNDIELPTRSTSGSAGYDFKAPFSFTLEPGEGIKIPTGIRCKMEPGWVLMCYPRSGLGFKYHVSLFNTVGVIDCDYYYSDNEGHIFCKLYNGGDKTISVNKNDGFMQSIFTQFGITIDDNATGVRNGGFGSTDNNSK